MKLPPEHDEQHDDRDLGDDDQRVHERRLARAAHQQQRQHQHDEQRRHVHDAADDAAPSTTSALRTASATRRRGSARRSSLSSLFRYSLHAIATVAAPIAYSRIRSQPMIHADQLAHRRVGVRVRAARDRDHRRELGVAQPRERAAERGDDEAQRHRRSGVVGRGGRGAHEQAGADDRADAERDQIERAQRALQTAAVFGLGAQVLDRFRREQRVSHGRFSFAAEHNIAAAV